LHGSSRSRCLRGFGWGLTEQHLVANGASDFLVAALSDKGKHARSAVGVAALPMNAPVEIEAILEIDQ